MEKIITALLAPRLWPIWAVIAALYFSVLLVPEPYATQIGFKELRESKASIQGIPWLPIMSLIGLSSTVFAICQIIRLFLAGRSRAQERKKILETLGYLSHGERRLLAYCLVKQQKTVCRSAIDQDASGLISHGLMEVRHAQNLLAVPYVVRPFVWEHITQNPQTVVGDIPLDSKEMKELVQRMDQEIESRRF